MDLKSLLMQKLSMLNPLQTAEAPGLSEGEAALLSGKAGPIPVPQRHQDYLEGMNPQMAPKQAMKKLAMERAVFRGDVNALSPEEYAIIMEKAGPGSYTVEKQK